MEQLSLELNPTKTLGRTCVRSILDAITHKPINDVIVKGKQVSFTAHGELFLHADSAVYVLHRHAFAQLCSKLRVPQDYISRLLRTGNLQHMAEWNLDQLMTRQEPEKSFLLRSVMDERPTIRGFLSTSYKRLNTISLISAFTHACKETGAFPCGGCLSDLQLAVLAALPRTWKVADRNVRIGVVLEHSDFGARALEVQFFLWDGGLLIGRKGLRRVHLGKRIKHANDGIEEATKKAGEDIISMVLQHLESSRVEATMAEIQLLAEQQVEPDRVTAIVSSLPLSEEEIKMVVDKFLSYNTHSVYHVAAALAWVGQNTDDIDRQIALAEMAGGLLLPSDGRSRNSGLS